MSCSSVTRRTRNLPVIHAFDRSVPLFVPIGYAWFCGGLLYLVARAFQSRVTAQRVWRLYGAIAVIDLIAIGLSSWIGILQFFGDPPMDIGAYPLWWAGIDGLDVVLGGTIVYVLLYHLHGRRQLWLFSASQSCDSSPTHSRRFAGRSSSTRPGHVARPGSPTHRPSARHVRWSI
jgi:hypothetical protein